MWPKQSFICPYCFEKVKQSEVLFMCRNKRCEEVDDIPQTKYLNGDLNNPVKGNFTFRNPSKFPLVGLPTRAACPKCNAETTKHVCPHCHNELSEFTVKGESMIISVVGSRGTGKSHFVGVLIRELTKRIAIKFGGSFTGLGETGKIWREKFESPLYLNHMKLQLTQSSLQSVDNGAYKPLIYNLMFKSGNPFIDNDIYTLVFFDTAGEDLNDIATMSTVNKYICKSAGIIFLLDPMQIPVVVNQLDAATVKRASAVDYRMAPAADDTMARVSQLIRGYKGLSQRTKIDIPVAAVFSKFDAIQSLVPSDFAVHRESPHCKEKFFDLADWQNVNNEIKALLREWDAQDFVQQLEMNYNTYSFFSASALGLGNNPDDRGGIQEPRPHRIEDPILWLLMENGVIKGKQS